MPPKHVFQADPTNCRIRSKRSVILINESGLYALILSSKLDRRLCRLAMDIQYRCQHFFFGEMAHNYFENQSKEFVQRRRSSRYDDCFRKLPEEFRTQQFMEVFGCSQQAASRAIVRFQEDGVVETVKYGLYRKLVSELP